jgi:hypothetical protein
MANPANDPPTQAIVAGENAGDFPAFLAALSDIGKRGAGLLRMAK